MRITGGKARGIPLKAPKGDSTRPATDRLRESVFSSLGPGIEGRRVADLFAGTGAYGLEALSRGAEKVRFYETDRRALQCLRQNIEAVLHSCRLPAEHAGITARDVYSLDQAEHRFDLIFIDPPYDSLSVNLGRLFETTLSHLADEGARVVLELPGNLNPAPEGWILIRRLGKAGRDKPTAAIFERANA